MADLPRMVKLPHSPTGAIPRTQNVSNSEIVHYQDTTSSVLSAVNSRTSHVLLGTAQVYFYSCDGIRITAKAILGPGSQHSFITSDLVERLGYETYKNSLNISGIGVSATSSNAMVNMVTYSHATNFKFKMSCSILDVITCNLPQLTIDHSLIKIPSHVNLTDATYFISSKIDILIGADYYYDLLLEGIINLGKNLPSLIQTKLGYIVAGHAPLKVGLYNKNNKSSIVAISTSLSEEVDTFPEISDQTCDSVVLHSQINNLDSLQKLVENFWALEKLPESKELSSEEQVAEDTFISTTIQLPDGTFQVDLPFKSENEHLKLGQSLPVAKQRFFNLEKKFKNNPTYFLEYKKFLEEYVELGHGHYVPLREFNENSVLKYYLPHHAVIREDRVTTKVRVVFDASCKTTSGVSLNDTLLKGYQVQPNIFDILLRFRTFKYVLIGDIEKMFRCIKVNPQHTFLTNILWRDNPDSPLKCIELDTLTFGTTCAPFLATRVIKHIANQNREQFPLAYKSLSFQTYVDDTLSGCNSLDELQQLYNDLKFLLNPCGFRLHKWHSNSKEFLKQNSLSNSPEVDLNKDETLSPR